jgi:hypothetical protein
MLSFRVCSFTFSYEVVARSPDRPSSVLTGGFRPGRKARSSSREFFLLLPRSVYKCLPRRGWRYLCVNFPLFSGSGTLEKFSNCIATDPKKQRLSPIIAIHPRPPAVPTLELLPTLPPPLVSLSFQLLVHTFAQMQHSTPFVSDDSALFAKNTRGRGGVDIPSTFGRPDLQTLRRPFVPLQPNAFGATICKGAGILYVPGKQLRSPWCLKILSGHREPFDDVPGYTPI